MTKALHDLMGRLDGDLIGLRGVMSKMAAVPPPSNPTYEQVGPSPAPSIEAKLEDYQHAKKLLEEIEGLCKSAGTEIDKELKIQEPPASSSTKSK